MKKRCCTSATLQLKNKGKLMARSKKEASYLEVNEASEPKTVRVFSQRIGDIILNDGTVLKHGDVLLVSESTATWIEASFKGLVKRID